MNRKLTQQEIEVFYYLDSIQDKVDATMRMYKIAEEFDMDPFDAEHLHFLWMDVSSHYDTYESVEITEDEGKIFVH